MIEPEAFADKILQLAEHIIELHEAGRIQWQGYDAKTKPSFCSDDCPICELGALLAPVVIGTST